MVSVVEFRDLTPTTMPIRAESSRIDAKAVKKIFFLLLVKLMFLPEFKIPARKSLMWVIVFEVFEMDWDLCEEGRNKCGCVWRSELFL